MNVLVISPNYAMFFSPLILLKWHFHLVLQTFCGTRQTCPSFRVFLLKPCLHRDFDKLEFIWWSSGDHVLCVIAAVLMARQRVDEISELLLKKLENVNFNRCYNLYPLYYFYRPGILTYVITYILYTITIGLLFAVWGLFWWLIPRE